MLDAVAMVLPQQTHHIVKPVNNHGEQTDDVRVQTSVLAHHSTEAWLRLHVLARPGAKSVASSTLAEHNAWSNASGMDPQKEHQREEESV